MVGETFFVEDCGGTTLGDCVTGGGLAVGEVESRGNGSILLSCVDKSSKAFLTGSPAVKDGCVEDGGCVKMVVMSRAACLRKSVMETLGKGTVVGKKSTVSQSLSDLVLGK